ncbi:MAG: pyridoxamine 5'-phosphate oxidase family protein [Candidatus Adiutrix sp.]|jgi:nitroimidazol reductase NimA-like FMN-containing flavoprotein (pyridoxamine 5'-phosphate oxidase superfamily)|nr:pyridoxamine 5'-phosphate oxidase family protein [Candidatus Adiutrix sp.]
MEDRPPDGASMIGRPIRRKDRALGPDECLDLLGRGEYGILATVDAGGQPYAVPLSYVFLNGRIYFHCALEGHKVANIRHNSRASFAVVGKTEPVYDQGFSRYYESVIVFGPLRPVEEEREKHAALRALVDKYLPANLSEAEDDIKRLFSRTLVYRLEPAVLTGKAKKKK